MDEETKEREKSKKSITFCAVEWGIYNRSVKGVEKKMLGSLG